MLPRTTLYLAACLMLLSNLCALSQSRQPEWSKIEEETMRHFQSIIRINSSDPPGVEAPVAAYLKSVLDKEGIETKIFSMDPKRPNLVARIKGTGKKKPILIMGHMDVVNVDSTQWKFPPYGAVRDGGYVYGRGTMDDKDNVVACLMVMLITKRMNLMLDRDIIFLAESGEEGNPMLGIGYMINEHWPEVEAEYAFAEGGGVVRTGGKMLYSTIATTEKVGRGVKLVAHGIAGHGSVPLQTNAIVHLSRAIANVTAWQTPMRLNETTRTYFERLAALSTPVDAARYNAILSGKGADAAQEYFATYEPAMHSILRTSISPNIIKGGYRGNVIPSEAEATLDIRALPDEDMNKIIDEMRRVINDSQVEIVGPAPLTKAIGEPSKVDSEAFRIAEATAKKIYNVPTLPIMFTAVTDMAFLRGKGVQCYGIGPMYDTEDAPKGFGMHGDQERILEEALHKFVRFHYDLVATLAKAEAN